MTFEQFRSTGRDVANIDEATKGGDPDAFGPGRVYLRCLPIEDTRGWANDRNPGAGRWYLLLDRSEFRSDDLETLERKLYQYAYDEGFIVSTGPDLN